MTRAASRLLAVLGPVLLAGVLALFWLAAPAQARPVERGVIDDAFSIDIDDYCDTAGLDVHLDVTITGSFTVKTRGPGKLGYYAEHTRVTNRITSRTTADFVTYREATVNKDLHITDNGDGTVTIVFFATGNSSITDSSGTVIARNPGQVRFRVVIDLNDPADPEDDVELSFEQIKGSTGRSDDFCTAVVGALV